MSRKLKSKSQGGGAGLQFDKLLKACSNSKKPSVTKTAGALGRFGIASYTSTRKYSFDGDPIGEEESRFSSSKRPRFDVERNLAELAGNGNSFRYGENLIMPSCTVQLEQTPLVVKPKKFFKSRNPENEQNQRKEGSESVASHLPPLPMPIKIPTPRIQNAKQFGKKGDTRRRESTSSSDAEMKAFYNTTNVASCASDNSKTSSTSPSIKLRIFKDKKTAKFVSVSDTTLPPKLVPQIQKDENVLTDVHPKKRGRKPKLHLEDDERKNKPVKVTKSEAVPQRRSGRLTRNSFRLRSSDSVGDMPVLIPAHDDLESDESLQDLVEREEDANSKSNVEKVDSAEKLVRRLEEEDVEFRELTAMLSSMEDVDASGKVDKGNLSSDSPSPMPPSNQFEEELPPQPSPINYSINTAASCRDGDQLGPVSSHDPNASSRYYSTAPSTDSSVSFRDHSVPVPYLDQAAPRDHQSPSLESLTSRGHQTSSQDLSSQGHVVVSQDTSLFSQDCTTAPSRDNLLISRQQAAPNDIFTDTSSSSDTASRDFRSILEDEWDESYEDESPRRSSSSSPTKVSRFVMPEFGSGKSSFVESPNQQHYQVNATVTAPTLVSPQLNSSYAVRNLLSEITSDDSSFQSTVQVPQDFTTAPLATETEISENGETMIPHSPEKPITSKDLIGSAKKVSIFKSRLNPVDSLSGPAINPKKRLALYKHKFGQEAMERPEITNPTPVTTYADGFDDEPFSDGALSLRRRNRFDEHGNEICDGSKVYCSQQTKKLFTVVRNVKAVHELQESGEVHEFDGDIWYILEDLKESNPVSNRCLSAITLATRCMEPAFRMHLRAHGTVAEFSRELRDAPNNIPVLALAAATVLFVLSQDRLNMDLDTESFLLILALAKTEQNSELLDENPELSKHKQRIIDLVQEMKDRGHAKHIKIEKITASELALETLLFLTSKRAGEWVKRELRTLGGLDYIVSEIEKALSSLECAIAEAGWGESLSDILWKIDRCLKVIQQVTFNHEENQRYLLGLKHETSELPPPMHSPELFVRLFQFLSHHLSYRGINSDNYLVLREVLFSALRVLVNLTHDYRGIVLGSEILSKHEGFLYLTLHSIFTLSNAFADGKGFDLLMHSLCMLLNIVEHSRKNREVVLSMRVQLPGVCGGEIAEEASALDALIQLFFQKEREAQKEEASTDDILTNSTDSKADQGQAPDSQNSSQESKDSENSSVQDIIDKLIETAGKHMENSMIAAHISLLIAYLVMDNTDSTAHLIKSMPNSRLLPLMILLKKLFNFMSITTSTAGSTRGLKATSIALKFFEKCDPESAIELKKVIPD